MARTSANGATRRDAAAVSARRREGLPQLGERVAADQGGEKQAVGLSARRTWASVPGRSLTN